MKFLIELDLENDAFKPHPEEEINQILDSIMVILEYRSIEYLKDGMGLNDRNGNRCGKVEIKK